MRKNDFFTYHHARLHKNTEYNIFL